MSTQAALTKHQRHPLNFSPFVVSSPVPFPYPAPLNNIFICLPIKYSGDVLACSCVCRGGGGNVCESVWVCVRARARARMCVCVKMSAIVGVYVIDCISMYT